MNLLKKLRKKTAVEYSISGNSNKIISETNNVICNIEKKHKNCPLQIVGNNNTVIFHTEKQLKSLPHMFSIIIYGNNNLVEVFYPNATGPVDINISGNNAKLTIQEQKKYPLCDVHFLINRGGEIHIGKNCQLCNGNFLAIVKGDYKEKHKLIIGDGCYIAKNATFRTFDGHTFIDRSTNLPLNPPADITVGNNCWIMQNCMILHGAVIPDNSAVAANSLVNKKFTESNILLAGCPAKIIKNDILWHPFSYGEYMEQLYSKD